MKSLQLLFLLFSLGLFIGCEPGPCKFVECGPGDCVEGICDCPDGFTGDNCEIQLCFGVACINGDCDPQTESCNCHPNYYGQDCNILCVNGEFANGSCNCSEGYEGITCETASRDRFLGWWGCEQWTIAPQIGGTPVPGVLPGPSLSNSLKFEEGYKVNEIELFPTENSNGLMLLRSDKRITAQITENTFNIELQYLTTEVTVYGSASLDTDSRILSVELFVFNPITTFTQVVKGSFFLVRNING